MFSIFKKKKPVCPVDDDNRRWIEGSLRWLAEEFDSTCILQKKVFFPHHEFFPIIYNGNMQNFQDTLEIVARQMDIDPAIIKLDIYSEGDAEIDTGSPWGNKIYITQSDHGHTSGLYHGLDENGQFNIRIELKNLDDPEGMVATMAHELAHVKLLGEGRIEENNEYLTDLATIIFGFGVFNANTAFRFHGSFDKWQYMSLGYLTQIEWGYALAVFTMMRMEPKPGWAMHLNATVKAKFEMGVKFISENGLLPA